MSNLKDETQRMIKEVNKQKKKGFKQNDKEVRPPMKSCIYHDGVLYEQVYDKENGHRFIFMKDGKPEYCNTVNGFVPIKPLKPENDGVIRGVVSISDGIEEYDNVNDLVESIRVHIHKYLDVAPEHELFASYYVLLSWLQDKMTTINYLRAMGDWGSGKTRYLNVIGDVCYKPIRTFGSLTTPTIFRMLDLWNGTLIIDEADFAKSDEQQDVIKILNSGFEKQNSTVMRCNPNDVSIVDMFNVYGTKIISSRKEWKDKALETRCLTERMKQTGRKDIIPILDNPYYKEVKTLNRKLLKFRFDYYDKIDYEYTDLGIENIEPRLKQAVSSFGVLLNNFPGVVDRFKKFVENYNKDLIEERVDSFEGVVVQSLVNLIMNGQGMINSVDISNECKESFAREYNNVGVGRLMKSFGFRNKVIRVENKTKRCYAIDPENLIIVVDRYLPVGHEFREIVRKYDKNVTDVTDVTLPYGGPVQSVTEGSLNRPDRPSVTSVTSVTPVTFHDKIRNAKQETTAAHVDYWQERYGFTNEEVDKMKREGVILETSPGVIKFI